MFARRVVLAFFIVAAGLLLNACGGGGGGSSSSSSPQTPSTVAFPLAQADMQLTINGFQVPIKLSGKTPSTSYSGVGTYGVSTPTIVAQFENQTAMQSTETLAATLTMSGQTVPYNFSGQDFYDSNYNLLGYVDSAGYTVVTSQTPLPTSVHVNDSGTWKTLAQYTDSSKATVISTSTVTYKLEADTATSVIFAVTTSKYDTNHQVIDTSTERYRVTESGAESWVSVTVQYANGDQLQAQAQ